jgi:hypothetical protein
MPREEIAQGPTGGLAGVLNADATRRGNLRLKLSGTPPHKEPLARQVLPVHLPINPERPAKTSRTAGQMLFPLRLCSLAHQRDPFDGRQCPHQDALGDPFFTRLKIQAKVQTIDQVYIGVPAGGGEENLRAPGASAAEGVRGRIAQPQVSLGLHDDPSGLSGRGAADDFAAEQVASHRLRVTKVEIAGEFRHLRKNLSIHTKEIGDLAEKAVKIALDEEAVRSPGEHYLSTVDDDRRRSRAVGEKGGGGDL